MTPNLTLPIMVQVKKEHPDWDNEQVSREAVSRLNHETVKFRQEKAEQRRKRAEQDAIEISRRASQPVIE